MATNRGMITQQQLASPELVAAMKKKQDEALHFTFIGKSEVVRRDHPLTQSDDHCAQAKSHTNSEECPKCGEADAGTVRMEMCMHRVTPRRVLSETNALGRRANDGLLHVPGLLPLLERLGRAAGPLDCTSE